jgi:hypothetical protein
MAEMLPHTIAATLLATPGWRHHGPPPAVLERPAGRVADPPARLGHALAAAFFCCLVATRRLPMTVGDLRALTCMIALLNVGTR